MSTSMMFSLYKKDSKHPKLLQSSHTDCSWGTVTFGVNRFWKIPEQFTQVTG